MITKTRKITNKNRNRNIALEEGFIAWTQFYLENPHRFCEDYLGLKLFLYQKIIIYMFWKFNLNLLIGSRGIGKSYIISLFSCLTAILKPNSKIVIASCTKNQAKLMITQKIEKELMNKSPMLRREIKEIKTNNQESVVVFKNGSTITAVVSGEGSRGYRATLLIVDESRLVSKDVVNAILRPFLNVQRTPNYLNKEEFKDYPLEPNKEIHLTSSYYANDYLYEMFTEYLDSSLVENTQHCVFNLNYRLAVEHRLLSKERVESIRGEYDEITWSMEMESLFWGESSNAFFKSTDINPCRKVVKAWNPPTDIEWLECRDKKKNTYELPKMEDEIRIISCDIALMKGSRNDNSVYSLFRLIRDGDGYKKQVVYIEAWNGLSSSKQSVRIKQLFFDFQADYIILDANGIGLSIYEELIRVQYCEERDMEYPPLTSYNDESMASRCSISTALPVIYTIKVTQLQLNHEIAMSLKESFSKNTIELLINDNKGKDFLIENMKLLSKSADEQARLIAPYIQTTALVNEIINLEYKIVNGFIKVEEKSTATKDRYSSLAYGNYLAKLLEAKLLKNKNKNKSAFISLW